MDKLNGLSTRLTEQPLRRSPARFCGLKATMSTKAAPSVPTAAGTPGFVLSGVLNNEIAKLLIALLSASLTTVLRMNRAILYYYSQALLPYGTVTIYQHSSSSRNTGRSAVIKTRRSRLRFTHSTDVSAIQSRRGCRTR